MKTATLSILILISIFSSTLFAQNAVELVIAEQNQTKYFVGITEPDSNWYKADFDDSNWVQDTMAIIGHSYGEGEYTKIDQAATSLYLRCPFTIEDKEALKTLNLLVDYDDSYIAYINGIEVARVNINKNNQYPAFNDTVERSHYSEFVPRGDFSMRPVLGIYLDEEIINSCIVKGENTLAIQVLDNNLQAGILIVPYLFDITNVSYNFYNNLSRFKRQVEIDSANLPIVMIETSPMGISYNQSIWSKSHMGIVNNGAGLYNKTIDAFNEYDGLISIRSRGQSSRDFPKKSYRFELIDSLDKDTTVALLGMPKESDWILFGPYTDKSQIRNKLMYDLGISMGHYAPRSRFVELMINGQDEGLYMLTEQIKRDKNRVDVSKLKTTDISGYNVTGGYIFKYDKTDPNSKTRINNREIVYPDTLQAEQEAYLNEYFDNYDSILLSNSFDDPYIGFRRYASDSSLVDYLIISEIAKNADSYIYSTYLHKDRDDEDGRMKFGPLWDYDLSFGNTHFQSGNKIEGWQWDINKPMKLTRYLQDRKFVELLQNRFWELRNGPLHNDSIIGYMNILVDQVAEVRERNYNIWPIIDKELFGPGYYVDNYEDEIDYMQNWIYSRIEWIEDNIDDIYYELVRVDVNVQKWDYDFSVYPNPFAEELRFVFNTQENSTIKIQLYNTTGQCKYTYTKENAIGINDFYLSNNELSSFQKGIYFVKLSVNGVEVKTEKLIRR